MVPSVCSGMFTSSRIVEWYLSVITGICPMCGCSERFLWVLRSIAQPEMAPGTQQPDVEVGKSGAKMESRPPEAPKPEEVTGVTQAIWNRINDFVHLPVIEYVFNNCLWSSQLLMGPVYFLLYQLLALHDFVTGYVWWRYQQPTKQPILITGCDTGFGNSLAVSLYEKGWTVYATCLTDAGMARLSEKGSADRLIPVKLDVTKTEQIDALAARVQAAHPEGIYALVNNAGEPQQPH